MKKSIINQMRQIVRDIAAKAENPKWVTDDAERHYKILEAETGEFIWSVNTDMALLDIIDVGKLIKNAVEDEHNRYALMHEVGVRKYTYGESWYFYYDGHSSYLKQVTEKEYKDLYSEHIRIAFGALCTLYPNLTPSKKPIRIEFNCPLSFIREQIQYAEKTGCASMIEALKYHFRGRLRMANDHKIVLFKDPWNLDHGFGWGEYLNDELRMRGSIEPERDGAWHIHT